MRPVTRAAGRVLKYIKKAGTLVGGRSSLNFIEGSNVTITTTDNPALDRVDVTIASSGGGGGGGSPDLDGGFPDSTYGGVTPLDAGGP